MGLITALIGRQHGRRRSISAFRQGGNRKVALVGILLLSIVAGCRSADVPPPLGTLSDGNARGLVWLKDGNVVLNISAVGSAPTTYLIGDPRRGPVVPAPLSPQPPSQCTNNVVTRIASNGQGTLDLIVQCQLADRSTTSFVVNYPRLPREPTGDIIRQFQYPPPWSGNGPLQSTSSRSASNLFAAESSPWCGNLWQAKGDLTVPVDVVIGDGSDAWDNGRTAIQSASLDGHSCDQGGYVYGPTLDPSGKILAFVSSGVGIGMDSSDYTLEFYDVASKSVRRVAKGLPGAFSTRWSPDGHRVMLSGSESVHVVRDDGGVDAIETGTPCFADWSPDGQQIVMACSHVSSGRIQTTDVSLVPAPRR